MDAEQSLLEGHISVMAALEAHSREVTALYIRQDNRDRPVARLERVARQEQVPVHRVDGAAVDELAQGKSHGGVVAVVGPRRFVALDGLGADTPAPFVVMIDGIEDPFNFGQAVRALYAAGAHGLVLRPRNWMSAAGTVARASAGASERIPVAIAESAAEAADFFRSRGLAVACAVEEQAQSLYAADLTGPLFVLIGGEKRGITRSFVRQADLRLRIPYARSFDQSLGSAAAAAVLGFEVMRQRQQ